jgi:hypothetical protein
MRLPYACPVEIWLQVTTFLCTRDVILLSHLQISICYGGTRKKRQDIQQFLSTFVENSDGFRRLMQKTGGIIVGEMATAFFTGMARREVHSLDLVLYNTNVGSCANAWLSFLKGKVIVPGKGIPTCTSVDQKVCSC